MTKKKVNKNSKIKQIVMKYVAILINILYFLTILYNFLRKLPTGLKVRVKNRVATLLGKIANPSEQKLA